MPLANEPLPPEYEQELEREARRDQQARGGEDTEEEEEDALSHDFGQLTFMLQPQAQKGKATGRCYPLCSSACEGLKTLGSMFRAST